MAKLKEILELIPEVEDMVIICGEDEVYGRRAALQDFASDDFLQSTVEEIEQRNSRIALFVGD